MNVDNKLKVGSICLHTDSYSAHRGTLKPQEELLLVVEIYKQKFFKYDAINWEATPLESFYEIVIAIPISNSSDLIKIVWEKADNSGDRKLRRWKKINKRAFQFSVGSNLYNAIQVIC